MDCFFCLLFTVLPLMFVLKYLHYSQYKTIFTQTVQPIKDKYFVCQPIRDKNPTCDSTSIFWAGDIGRDSSARVCSSRLYNVLESFKGCWHLWHKKLIPFPPPTWISAIVFGFIWKHHKNYIHILSEIWFHKFCHCFNNWLSPISITKN